MQTSQNIPSQSGSHLSSDPHSKLIEIERNFHVPLEQLYSAFTTPEALKQWWWPRGLYADQIEMDFRVGGKYFINMQGLKNAGGMTGEFQEIIQNQRIVMTDQFADDKGNPLSPEEVKMPGKWPEIIYITFDFESVDEKTSRFKLYQEGIPLEVYKDCLQGWSESFDKLREYLSQ